MHISGKKNRWEELSGTAACSQSLASSKKITYASGMV
jgi:hypothetical protein